MLAVHSALSDGEHYAVIIEPMQSEGGDRYLPSRFYRALRLITRAHHIALIMDEVQTGLDRGPFSWASPMGCRPQVPARNAGSDHLLVRAQVGVVMSGV